MGAAEEADRLAAALSRFNPAARIVPATGGRVPPGELLGTGLFDLTKAQEAPGWVAELNGDHVPETEEYGVTSLVFRAERPFHPGRLWELVSRRLDAGEFGAVLRSKGFVWLASRPAVTGLWSQAGSVARFEPSGMRSTMSPPTPLAGLTDATALTGLGEEQVPSGQELVFIGTGLRKDELRAALTHCLLDGAEHAAGPHAWTAFEDPFPAWDEYELLQDHDHSHA